MSATSASATTPYLLLFRNTGPEVFEGLNPQQREDLINRWNQWFGGLVEAGKAVEGQPLQPETRVVAGVGGTRVTDGPFPETKEAVGGYVKLLVSGLDEATAIAQGHPALAHGMLIEVRALTPDCHLGVNTLSTTGAQQTSPV